MKKIVLTSLVIFISLLGVAVYDYLRFYDGKLHLIFCNVGQGDAIFVRTPKAENILIDVGPSSAVESCISSHTPFWDRKISLALLTHPHLDHFTGFRGVFKKYNVIDFTTERLSNKTAAWESLQREIDDEDIKTTYVYQGDSFRTGDGVRLLILAPTSSFLSEVSPNGAIGETQEQACIISYISYGSFKALLTCDSQSEELYDAIKNINISRISVLQVPHHGSKTGLSSEILDKIKPSAAVISVGLNNRYGHPSFLTLNLLKDYGIKTLRTDLNGEIEIVSDGRTN